MRHRGSVEDRPARSQAVFLCAKGVNEGCWALLDYGEVIVHILQPSERSYYDLEAF